MQELKEYQALDMKKRKIEQEILENEDRKNAKEMQSKLKEFQSKIFALEDKASLVVKKYEDQLALLEKLTKDVEKASGDVEKTTEEDASSQVSILMKIKDNLLKLEREFVEIQKTQEKIVKDNAFVMKNAVIANKNLSLYKERYNNAKQAREPEIAEIEKQMSSLATKINKQLLAKYKAVSEVKPLPVFVPLVNGKCNGCRMEMPIVLANTLKQKGYLECENCGRIIYFEEK